jgi:EEF1A lysine methyltransferase 2
MEIVDYQKTLFEAFSKHYNENSDVWTKQMEMRIIPALIQGKLKLKENSRILDIGCGVGCDSVYFAKIFSAVTAIDIIRHPEWDDLQQSYKNINFIQTDITNLINSGDFNLIIDNGCFHHQDLSNYEKYLTAVKSMLRENGWYILSTFKDTESRVVVDANQRIHKYFDDEELNELLLSNNLLVKEQLDIFRIDKNNYYRLSYIQKYV